MKCLGIFLFCLASLVGFTYADDSVQNPVTLIQNSVNSLQSQIEAGGPALANNPHALFKIIKTTVMPLVAIDQMSGLALGPKWRTATPAQQQQFIDQFGLLLTKTYTSAILSISDYKIMLNPMRSNAWQTAQYVSVTGQITSMSNGKSSQITYYLERKQNSWQIYDLAIEGVSFLKNYQTQFQAIPDMDTLLAKLQKLNGSSDS